MEPLVVLGKDLGGPVAEHPEREEGEEVVDRRLDGLEEDVDDGPEEVGGPRRTLSVLPFRYFGPHWWGGSGRGGVLARVVL